MKGGNFLKNFKRRKFFMKKNVLLKSFLVLVLVSLLVFSMTGCYPAPPIVTTGTLYITIGGWYPYYDYDIYFDYAYMGYTTTGSFTIYNITPGTHTLGAYEYWTGWPWDTITVYITTGANYVTISPY